MDESPRDPRFTSTVRGIAIGALIATYAGLTHQTQVSFSAGLIIAAALQLSILLVRRFVAPDVIPRAIYVCEMLADGATVLLFALAVLGSIIRTPDGL